MWIFLDRFRRSFVVLLHLGLIALANYAAFWLRFDGEIPEREWNLMVEMFPLLLFVRGLTFVPFRLYEGLWRYTSIWDLRNIVVGVGASTALFYGVVHWGIGMRVYPRSVFVIDSLLLIVLMSGVRLVRRAYREFVHLERDKRILIYGAGDAGEMIVRDMRNNPLYEYEPVGFIDDDPSKGGQRIHGVKVLGTRSSLAAVVAEKVPDAILVAIPRAEPAEIRKVVKALESFKVPIMTVPSLRDILGGKIAVSQIRNLSIEDLLERAPVGLAPEPLRALIGGKRVLVTGAGGSIGSELCRQIAGFGPASLILYERYENGLYEIANELESPKRLCPVHATIGDVTDERRVNAVMAEHRPQIVFHAAAHKHVPLMELNPCEAIKNNVTGTRTLAESARTYHAERFVLISTDKAVNPASVMGASKRVAEFIVQAMNRSGQGAFSCVRFGNVLGSNGSVVPRFLQQIKAGGPVTVTHPDMRRFFMLIPEAVQLVLHAAALAKGGDTFVLEIGQQIRVLDMARNLIRLSGFVPEEDIPIVFTGIRSGEKLFEELVGADEHVEPAAMERILRVQARHQPNPETMAARVVELERLAAQGEVKAVTDLLARIVPTFRSQ